MDPSRRASKAMKQGRYCVSSQISETLWSFLASAVFVLRSSSRKLVHPAGFGRSAASRAPLPGSCHLLVTCNSKHLKSILLVGTGTAQRINARAFQEVCQGKTRYVGAANSLHFHADVLMHCNYTLFSFAWLLISGGLSDNKFARQKNKH